MNSSVTRDRLADVFRRGLRDGADALSPTERELFRVQQFVFEHEMGGLSGYFYNRLPDLSGIEATVAAMRQHGLTELSSILNEASGLFAPYSEAEPPKTWEEVCRQCDPDGVLEELDERIEMLDDYGLAET